MKFVCTSRQKRFLETTMQAPTTSFEQVPGSNRSAIADDSDLLNAAQSGDCVAFTELCRRHRNPLLWRLQRLTRNPQDAEDSLQDAFLNAFRNLNRFQRRSSLSSWLTAIAINAGLMTIRKRRMVMVSLDDQTDPPQGFFADNGWHHGVNPEVQYQRRESQAFLSTAVRRLPFALRSATELRVNQDLSIREIARDLGISESAVKSRLARARALLRDSIGACGLRREKTRMELSS
jgi:RNA polymerase sigma-70 factor, ECF subfamily